MASVSSSTSNLSQLTVDAFFDIEEAEGAKKPLPPGVKNSVTKKCVEWCSEDIRPFKIVHGKGFLSTGAHKRAGSPRTPLCKKVTTRPH